MTRRTRQRAKARGAAVLNDGLESMAMAMGQRQNSMTYARTQFLTDNRQQLLAMWIEDWISRKICDRKSRDMTRRWRDVKANSLTAEQIDQYQQLERRLKVREVFREACQWASLFGTAAVMMITDAQDVSLPIKEGEAVKRLVVADRHSISADGVQNFNVLSPDFGMPEYYRIKSSDRIHRSRLILIRAGERPLSDTQHQWGTSDLEHVYAAIKRFDLISLNIGELVNESKLDIFKMEGFSNKIAAGQEELVMRVMAATQRIKSISNSLLLDKDAEYEQKELTFTGLRDLMVEFRNAVAGAADMPVTILFGQSASGFASGKEDIDSYYDSIHGLQESRLRPALDRLDGVLCPQLFGAQPEDWWYEFPALGEMTETEKNAALLAFAQAMALLIQNGILREDQVASELKQSALFDNISDEDVDKLKSMVSENLGSDPYGFNPITAQPGQANPAQPAAATNNAVEANRGVVPAPAH